MRILIIEDDVKMSNGIKRLLEVEGYDVDEAHNGIDGMACIETGIYNLALVDINLPDRNGFSIVYSLREAGVDTPVIFLTARSDVEDRLRGFELGAVDYIIKPFDVRELLVRIKLRIGEKSNYLNKRYTLSGTFLDASNYTISYKDKDISLNKKEFLMLEQLFLNEGKIITRDKIIASVWGIDEYIEERTLDVYMSLIRKKLKYINSPLEIVTKRSVGYIIKEKSSD